MKRLIFTPVLICLLNLNVDGQPEIVKRVSQLEAELHNMKKHQRDIDSLDYATIRTNLKTAVELSFQTNEVYNSINAEVETASINNLLASVNNPTSDILGFTFSNIIMSKAKEILNSDEFKAIPEKKKTTFFTIMDKIINNPIVSAISSSFPITGTVRSVITAASTFFSQPNIDLDVKKSSGKVTDVAVKDIKGDNGLDNRFIEKYLATLQPYVTFYEKLEYSNLQYDVSTKALLKNYKNLPKQLKGYESEMDTRLGSNIDSTLNQKIAQIDMLSRYYQSSQPDFKYMQFLLDQRIIEANNISKQIGMMTIQLENFYNEFVLISNDKLNADREILEDAKKLEGAKPDKIEVVRARLAEFQRSGNVDRYKTNVNQIIILRNKITY